jgi:hypothetical protein
MVKYIHPSLSHCILIYCSTVYSIQRSPIPSIYQHLSTISIYRFIMVYHGLSWFIHLNDLYQNIHIRSYSSGRLAMGIVFSHWKYSTFFRWHQSSNTQITAAAGMRAVVVAASLRGPSGTSAQSLLTCEHRLQVSQNYLSITIISVYLSISIGFQWFPTQPCDWGIPNFVRMPKRTASAKFWLQFWRRLLFAK